MLLKQIKTSNKQNNKQNVYQHVNETSQYGFEAYFKGS